MKVPGRVKQLLLLKKICHEELNKGRYPMLQCWEGSEVAVLSEGVGDTW